jgi:hypothetical protein
MLMGMSMKENGKMTKLMDMVNTIIQMEHVMRVCGKKINNMVEVKKLGRMVLVMKEIISKVKKMA